MSYMYNTLSSKKERDMSCTEESRHEFHICAKHGVDPLLGYCVKG